MLNRLTQTIHSYVPIGLLIWSCLWFVPEYDQVERILLFAVYVVVPLGLYRVFESGEGQWVPAVKGLVWLIPFGAILLSVSLLLTPGLLAGMLALPWSTVTVLIASIGARALVSGRRTTGGISRAIGFVYVSVAGIWLAAHQFGVSLLGFEGQIMLLTANHFHYAGFAAPLLFGFLHDHRSGGVAASTVVVLGGIAPILIALGMTYSPLIEWASVIVFAASLILYSIVVLVSVAPKAIGWTRWLHILSASTVWVTMALAVLYAFGEWTGQPTVSIPTMVTFHGWGNAVLLSFVGLLAWHSTLMDQGAAAIPFSRIRGNGKIGAAIFDRLGVVDRESGKQPSGLSDSLAEFSSAHCHPELLHPDIALFYEHTDDYELLVTPHWRKLLLPAAKLYKLASERLAQMNFPLQAESSELHISSTIVPIRDERDGRRNVRAWIRTYRKTGTAIYAALYASHTTRGTPYMNIAFPLPYCQMSSILNVQDGPDRSLRLTSWREDSGSGDQGVYLVFQKQAIRLPINETIVVWKQEGSAEGEIQAEHRMWLFGMQFLTLDYAISKKKQRTTD